MVYFSSYHSLFCFILYLKSARANTVLSGSWLEWQQWSVCTETVYCLEGSRQRQRQCELDKYCVGIEAESEGCPKQTCQDREVFPDISSTGEHSFIQEECFATLKYYNKGKYRSMMKHNVTNLFPKAKEIIENTFFNVRFTRKQASTEHNIFKYCFEPATVKPLTIDKFKELFFRYRIYSKYTTIFDSIPTPQERQYVTGFVIGVQEHGEFYAVYAQTTTDKDFHTVYYGRSPGFEQQVKDLIW